MKKFIRLLTVSAFSFLILLCAGCSGIDSGDAFVFPSDSSLISSGMRNITLLVSSSENLLDTRNAGARTLSPGAYDSGNLKFYLGGKNIGTGESLTVQKVAFVADENSSSSGRIIVPLNSYNYQLVLLAVPSSQSVSITPTTYASSLAPFAVLAGSTTADLRYSDGSGVTFYLSSDGLAGNGSFNLSMYLRDWSEASLLVTDPSTGNAVVDNVSLALWTLTDKKVVSGTDISALPFSSATSSASAYSYANAAVPAGTYELCATFSYNGKSFIYSDKIVILPYQTTSAVIGIPDIMQVVPIAPSDFKQGYVLPDTDASDYYRVAFSWADNSNTETGFELQLLDASSISGITTSTVNDADAWSGVSPSLITTYSSDFEGGFRWYAGTLARNSTRAVFYLPLGKRYLARIRSVNNDVGGSDWCYADSAAVSFSIAAGEATATAQSLASGETVSATAFDTDIINLYRLTYNLVGGTSSPVIEKTYYFDQIVGGIPILTPDGNSTNGSALYGGEVLLTKGSLDWSHWAIGSVDGETYPTSYTQCTASSVFDTNTTYYSRYSRSSRGLSSSDINGNSFAYVISNPQPEDFSTETNNYTMYYTTDGVLTNYIGSENLSLYAVYADNSGGTGIPTDYSIKSNLDFSILADGVACTLGSSYMFTVSENTANLILSYTYKGDFVYDTVRLLVSENGGSEIGTYEPVSDVIAFSPDISLDDSETEAYYTLTLVAAKGGAEYRLSLLMIVN